MAAIDSLLSLIDAQQASGIVLRVGQGPVLVGGKGRGLTMPPLDRDMVQLFVDEVLSAEEYEGMRAMGVYDSVYRSERHGLFRVETRLNGDNFSMKLLRGGANSAKVPPAMIGGSAPPASRLAPTSTTGISPAALDPEPLAHATALVEPSVPVVAASSPSPATVLDPRGLLLAEQIARAAGNSVSDIILSAGQPLWSRSANGLAMASPDVIVEADIRAFVEALMDGRRRRTLQEAGSVDFAWETPAVDGDGAQRFRVNVFNQARGLAATLRPVSRRAPGLAELNLPESLGTLATATGGMVLVVGPSGAGKSTTLTSLVETMNRTSARHVITLEDPIEFVYQPRRCLIHQREVGTHVETFAAGLRAALRECPDVILIGEMRDRETTELALTAAETGHLVLSTLHSGSAPMAIDRIVDIFPEHDQTQIRHQLAGSLRAVITQQLVQGTSPGTRYPAIELLMVSYAVGALIREGKTHQLATQIQTGRDEGMIALETSLVEMLRAGRITPDAALAAARSPAELQRRLPELAARLARSGTR